VFDSWTLAPKGEIPVGEHPNAMTLSADGKRLFVACANTNAVWTIDVASQKATEQISIALFPNAPPGSTPNALALSPDGQRRAVANADNNDVAMVDVSVAGQSRVSGFIPAGWYPTGALFSRDGRTLFVLSGKGLISLRTHGARKPSRGGRSVPGLMLQGPTRRCPTPPSSRGTRRPCTT
jgi:DNA-binding beta-propeller fold protein YncE